MRTILLVLVSVLLIAGCAETQTDDGATDEQQDNVAESDTAHDDTVEGDDHDDLVIQGPDEDVDASTAAQSTSRFGIDLFQSMIDIEPTENVIVSPYSAAMLLTMLLEGADGDTRQSISEVLHLEDPFDEQSGAKLQALAAELIEADPDVEFTVGNAIWAIEDVVFKDKFQEVMQERFRATIESADLDSQEVADDIDAWVQEQTQDRIDGISDELGLPDPQSIIVLANAIYFLGGWTDPFDPDETTTDTFRTADDGIVDVEMMNKWAGFEFKTGDDFDMLRLPYGEKERFAMDVILPQDGPEIAEFGQSLTLNNWNAASAELHHRPVDVSMPKFELEYGTERYLPDVLTDLGMGIAFDEELADFSRMTQMDPWLDDVVQKTFVRVDEKGTEAAAVTAGEMDVSEPPSFRVDRPFIFAISDTFTETLLFMGQVTDPTE